MTLAGKGEWINHEIRCGEPPQALRERVLTSLTPQLERTGLKLVEAGNPSLLYRRRYLPIGLLLADFLVIVSGAIVLLTALGDNRATIWIVLGVIAVLLACWTLLRRTERLSITILERAGGSTAIIAGYANDTARASIRHWTPPAAPQLDVVQASRTTDTSARAGSRRPHCEGA